MLTKLTAFRWDVLVILLVLIEWLPLSTRWLKTGLLWFAPRVPRS